MSSASTVENITQQFNNRVSVREAAPGIWQLFAPFYHADGDMMEIYLLPSERGERYLKVSDMGMTLMRLSYTNDIDSDSVQRGVRAILVEQNLDYDAGIISIDMPVESSITYIHFFAQGLSKVMAINALSRDISRSSFYDDFREFVLETFSQFNPVSDYIPVKGNSDFTVDYMLKGQADTPLFLFPIKDGLRGEIVVGTMLFMKTERVNGRCLIVPENLDVLPRRTKSKLVNISDKAYFEEEGFRKDGPAFINELLKTA